MAFSLVSCDGDDKKDDPLIGEDDFLKTEGTLIKNKKGETVYLRGVNVGGLFVTENWMNGFESAQDPTGEINIRTRDFRTISQVLVKRFGLEQAEDLWQNYQENWWSDADFENCAAMGMNCIRLPFTYMTVDFDCVESYDNAGDYDFSPLDDFIERAASYGLYTILDMHGAYGSQNGQDHSGETIDSADKVDFYRNSRMISLTANLWSAIVERYKDNPAVAGYDILNEPGEKAGSTNATHFAVFDKIYDAIREKDSEHIVIFESCWEGENLPHPSEYGWENCMYSFHHYTNMASGNQYTAHGQSWNEKIANIMRQNFGVPLHMGEFNNYNDAEQWEYVLDLLNRAGWHWNSWTYKLNNTSENSAWGIFTVPAVNKVNAYNDSIATILTKFAALKTTEETHKVEFGGKTLESIMKEYLAAPVQQPLAAGTYTFYDTLTDMPLMLDARGPKRSDDRNAGHALIVRAHPDGDGSVYLVSASSVSYLSVSGNDVSVSDTPSNSARFYPVETEYGYAFISFTTCRYLRFDEEGRLHPDGRALLDSAIFDCQ